MDEFYHAAGRLPGFLRAELTGLPPEQAEKVQELRLRSERPVMLTIQQQTQDLAALLKRPAGSIRLSHAQLKECFLTLCDHSLHSYENQLAQGFFTIPGGHRVGVAGLMQTEQGRLRGFQTVTSLNLRIARTVKRPLPSRLQELLTQEFRGLLMIGPPGSGKTTLLREVSRFLSDLGRRAAVIDERMELWPCGPFGFAGEVPLNCDVLSGISRHEGIRMALRCLAPQVILCDEICEDRELEDAERGIRAGVDFVCTVHGTTVEAVCERFGRSRRQLAAAFPCAVLVSAEPCPGTIREVCLL